MSNHVLVPLQYTELAWGSEPTISCKSKGCGTINAVIEVLPAHKAGPLKHYFIAY